MLFVFSEDYWEFQSRFCFHSWWYIDYFDAGFINCIIDTVLFGFDRFKKIEYSQLINHSQYWLGTSLLHSAEKDLRKDHGQVRSMPHSNNRCNNKNFKRRVFTHRSARLLAKYWEQTAMFAEIFSDCLSSLYLPLPKQNHETAGEEERERIVLHLGR